MTTKLYHIVRHSPRHWSIDCYLSGKFLHQVAFWFRSRYAAERRMAEIKAADRGQINWQKAF